MKTSTIFTAMFALATLTNASTRAATISPVGAIVNDSGSEISQFRTPGTPKTLDIDGNNIYGTFGGISFGDAVVGNMAFVSSQPQVGPFGSYSVVDDINGGADRQVVTTTNNGAAGADQVMYTFDVTAAVAANEIMRIGIALDGLDGTQFDPATIGVREQAGPGTSEVSVAANNNNVLDMYFFDVTGGVAAGTRFEVFADSGTGNFVTHQIVTLDVAAVAVPEPGTIGLAVCGAMGFGIVRRRRLRA